MELNSKKNDVATFFGMVFTPDWGLVSGHGRALGNMSQAAILTSQIPTYIDTMGTFDTNQAFLNIKACNILRSGLDDMC